MVKVFYSVIIFKINLLNVVSKGKQRNNIVFENVLTCFKNLGVEKACLALNLNCYKWSGVCLCLRESVL